MHTSRFDIPGYGKVTVHHNGGFDRGDVVIEVPLDDRGQPQAEAEQHEEERYGNDYVVPARTSVRLPAGLLLALGREVAFGHLQDQLVEFVEDLSAPTRWEGTPVEKEE